MLCDFWLRARKSQVEAWSGHFRALDYDLTLACPSHVIAASNFCTRLTVRDFRAWCWSFGEWMVTTWLEFSLKSASWTRCLTSVKLSSSSPCLVSTLNSSSTLSSERELLCVWTESRKQLLNCLACYENALVRSLFRMVLLNYLCLNSRPKCCLLVKDNASSLEIYPLKVTKPLLWPNHPKATKTLLWMHRTLNQAYSPLLLMSASLKLWQQSRLFRVFLILREGHWSVNTSLYIDKWSKDEFSEIPLLKFLAFHLKHSLSHPHCVETQLTFQ